MSDSALASSNKVTIEDAGPSRKKLVIEIPASAVEERLALAMDTAASEAALPGFRKGRVPRRLLEKRFGGLVRNEAKNELISAAYSEAVQEHNLRVIGNPEGGNFDEIEMEPGKPMTFTLEVEVMPEFELPELKGITVKRPDATVPEDLIDSEIEKVCINEGSLEQLDEPAAGDYLTGRGVMKGTVNGEEKTFHDIPGAVVRVPPEGEKGGMILGVIVDDFAKQLGLPKPGSTASIKVKGPENHEVEEVRGADLVITFEVERVDRIIPAEVADVVAKSGLQSEEQLRQMIRARLDQRAQVQQRSVQHQQVLNYLLQNTEMELPPRLSAAQAQRTLQRQAMELQYRGVDPAKIEQNIAQLRAASATAAVRELKSTFLLAKAAEQLGVTVDEGEINAQIVQMAASRGERPEKLRNDLIQTGRVQSLIQQVREHKTLDAILAQAEVEEMPVEEFNKLMSEQYAAATKA